MGMNLEDFGVTDSGAKAALVTLTNKKGMEISITNYGATLVSVKVPDRNQEKADVVLGYDDVSGYIKNGGYFGAVIGRNGNRIGKAEVCINGKMYQMDKNEKENDLHSGFKGFDKVIWDMEIIEKENTVKFHHNSPDGDQGLPGNFAVTVAYTLTDENEIKLQYTGLSDEDTIANMTNHSYFNLAGHTSGSIENHVLWLDSDAFTVIDQESIPTGELRSVKGTAMDFNNPKTIGDGIDDEYEQLQIAGGYDHNYVLKENKSKEVRLIARLTEPESERIMEVFTDCVGVQFYTGNYIENTQIGKGNTAYDKRVGLCMETQYFPDACHHENFPSTILKAGETYQTTTIYKFL